MTVKLCYETSRKFLLQTLVHPESVVTLSLEEWDLLLPLARQAGIFRRFCAKIKACGLLEQVPPPIYPHLEAAVTIAEEHNLKVHWEINRLQRALRDVPVPVVLLKGAAYVGADLPCAQGRSISDVDLLVAKEHLPLVEQALRGHSWETVELDDYDQQYYRRWMHELPPLHHRLRGTVVDLHHTILPETSRLKPDPTKLFANACPLEGIPFFVLAPTDMVLHSAAHAFHDGELSNSLRDLLDLYDLLCHFGTDPRFWEVLPIRARELDLSRPLFYALRYTQRFLGTPVPSAVTAAMRPAAPPWPVLRLMDTLLDRVVLPDEQPPRLGPSFARWLLYVRSHWLRMPPWLLAGHLLRKAHKRLQARSIQTDQEGVR